MFNYISVLSTAFLQTVWRNKVGCGRWKLLVPKSIAAVGCSNSIANRSICTICKLATSESDKLCGHGLINHWQQQLAGTPQGGMVHAATATTALVVSQLCVFCASCCLFERKKKKKRLRR